MALVAAVAEFFQVSEALVVMVAVHQALTLLAVTADLEMQQVETDRMSSQVLAVVVGALLEEDPVVALVAQQYLDHTLKASGSAQFMEYKGKTKC
jgi:hypothetical protein